MTEAEKACLDAIIALTVDGVPPSRRELAMSIGGKSVSGGQHTLCRLRDQGLITWRPDRARSIIVLAGNPAHAPAVLCAMSSEALRTLVAHASGILAHRDGAEAVDPTLRRIGDRLTGRPRVRG